MNPDARMILFVEDDSKDAELALLLDSPPPNLRLTQKQQGITS